MTWACRVFGHQPTFEVEGNTMHWACARCGEAPGAKEYGSPEDAQRFASAFNKRDADDLGKRAPLLGLLPLRIWRWVRRN
jgi:hypothetical protein